MRYELKALRGTDSVVALSLEALNESGAVLQAHNLGYTVLSIRSKRLWAGMVPGRRARFPLVLFSNEMVALLSAGLNLVEALETLEEKEHRTETKKVYEAIVSYLREGQPLSFALQRFPACFPDLFVATVRASEKTGDLSEALSRYVLYQTQMDLARSKLTSASIYPLMLIAVGGLVTLFLLTYVVPKFSRIYRDIGGELPLLSRLLLWWGDFIATYTFEFFVGIAALVASLIYAVTRPNTKRWLMRALLRSRAVRERLHVYQLARFYRTVGMLLRGGTPIMTALGMTAGLLDPLLREKLERASTDIRAGHAISRATEEHGLTTPVALRMLRVGERSGKMGEMMERIARFYDDEIARWLDWFTRLIEPLLMMLIGIIIGTIVVLMYFPIFELAGSIQ